MQVRIADLHMMQSAQMLTDATAAAWADAGHGRADKAENMNMNRVVLALASCITSAMMPITMHAASDMRLPKRVGKPG